MHRISSVIIGTNKDDAIMQNSVVEVYQTTLTDDNNNPKDNSVVDSKLGTNSNSKICSTCYSDKCTGGSSHEGYIQLKVGVYNPISIQYIRKWLKIICHKCFNLLTDRSKIPNIKYKLDYLAKINTNYVICKCGSKHPKVINDKGTMYIQINEQATQERLYPQQVKMLFECILDEVVLYVGMPVESHPKHLIMNTIIVTPNNTRPPIRSFIPTNNSDGSYNPETIILQTISKLNKGLPDNIDYTNINGTELSKEIQKLELCYTTLIKGVSTTTDQSKQGILLGTKIIEPILKSISGKEGLIRGALLGCRISNVYISTISGNPNLRINEVGISRVVAQSLQVQDTVQDYNKEYLMKFINNVDYPKCSSIIRNGVNYKLDLLKDKTIKNGDIIVRDIVDGDICYFNRAPTLEKCSFTAMNVKVFSSTQSSIQVNVLSCAFFNADFDGDQMTMWFCRGEPQRVEAKILSHAEQMYISIKTSLPNIGQVQDSIIGSKILTNANVKLNKYNMMSLFSDLNHDFDKEFYSGYDVVSELLLDTPINYNKPPTYFADLYAKYYNYEEQEKRTEIINGKMISGVLDKNSIGTDNGNIFHLIGREYGVKKTFDKLYELQQIAILYTMKQGFTISLSDLKISELGRQQIYLEVSKVLLESDIYTDLLKNNSIITPLGVKLSDFYNRQQKEILNVNENVILKSVFNSTNVDTNGLLQMIMTGSKGKRPNLIHISGVIGQSILDSNRMATTFDFGRTLPAFTRFSTEPESFGFVCNNYICGLTSTEFFFRAMCDRYDLISKSLATALSGYFMRKGIFSAQSAIVNNLRNVVKNENIIQYLYGSDGINACSMEIVHLNLLTKEFKLDSTIKVSDVIKQYIKSMNEDKKEFQRHYIDLYNSALDHNITKECLLPVSINRIIINVLNADKSIINIEENMDEKITLVEEFISIIPYIYQNNVRKSNKDPISNIYKYACKLLCACFRYELNPNMLLKISIKQLNFIFKTVYSKLCNSLVDYGSAVGVEASQTIAEPVTQYMLDSHHRSVEGGTTRSVIIRLDQIFSNKTETDVKMKIILKNPTKEHASNFAKLIEVIQLKDLVNKASIVFENYDEPSVEYKSDNEWINKFKKINIYTLDNITNWCIRLELDNVKIVFKNLNIDDICLSLNANNNNYILHNGLFSEKSVIRIWLNPIKNVNLTYEYVKYLLSELLETNIRGITNIVSAQAIERDIYSDTYTPTKGYLVETSGTNISDIMQYTEDVQYIISSSINDVYNTFGIEAARNQIILETKSALAEKTPNLRHIALFADILTRTGKLGSIERNGLKKSESENVLLNVANADPIGVLSASANNNIISPMYSYSDNLLLGSIAKYGPSYNSIVTDVELINSLYKKDVNEDLDQL